MLDKTSLRKELKEKLNKIPKALYEHRSYMIAQMLFKDPLWREANTIGITISIPPEVDTYQIIRKAWEEGKTIAVPKCLPKERKMDFHVLTCFDQLQSVYLNLLEPNEEHTEIINPENIDLLMVPGLGFSEDGYRLGVGGGYYDRFLEFYQGHTISIAFQEQILKSIPIEPHDLPVAKIITEERGYTIL